MLIVAISIGAGCRTQRRLDDADLYFGPVFRLRVTRYYENYPLHYAGEVYRVSCASAATAHAPAGPLNEAGWLILGNGSAIGTASAAEVAAKVAPSYRVFDDRTLVWIGTRLGVSRDGCGTFAYWSLESVPAAHLAVAPEPSAECRAPNPDPRLCGSAALVADDPVAFDDLRVAATSVAFVARSRRVRGGSIGVSTSDNGLTWTYENQGGRPR